MGLFIRGSLLARFLAVQEVYTQILDLPGIVLDLGTWRGQTAVLCENFRAIYEPLHFNRRICCFDTFEGYKGFSDKDKPNENQHEGSYSVSGEYDVYLNELLELHEKCNAMGHFHGKHHVVKGDCRKTIPGYFEEHPSEVVALCFFDLNSFEPTSEAFELVYNRLVPGGICVFWQLTRDVVPAEGRVYAEKIIGQKNHQLRKAKTYPGMSYLIKES